MKLADVFVGLVLYSTTVGCIHVSNPESLKKIYHISEAQGISIVNEFREYQDDVLYGALPNCLEFADLQTLNTTLD